MATLADEVNGKTYYDIVIKKEKNLRTKLFRIEKKGIWLLKKERFKEIG